MAGSRRAEEWWRFYCTSAGAKLVDRELRELNTEGRAALADAMKRHVKGELLPREHEEIDRDIRAIRVSIGTNHYRLLYARVGATSRVLLALTAIYKNQPRLPKKDLARARSRLRDWKSRDVSDRV